MFLPWFLGDPENFIEANNLSSPIHIKPEWYFLWAYAILRAIPSKVGGVISLGIAVVILYFIILKNNKINRNLLIKFIFFFIIFLFLTFLGGCPVEAPYILIRQIFSIFYFLFILIIFVYTYRRKVLIVLFIILFLSTKYICLLNKRTF